MVEGLGARGWVSGGAPPPLKRPAGHAGAMYHAHAQSEVGTRGIIINPRRMRGGLRYLVCPSVRPSAH